MQAYIRKIGYGKQDEEECRRISNIQKIGYGKQDKEECRRISNNQVAIKILIILKLQTTMAFHIQDYDMKKKLFRKGCFPLLSMQRSNCQILLEE
ncbi:hypothetical protein CEXT_573261 [Caerostris extrusa]|uniref:Uncharacterized protein n=1 Tax=Caerostris extrusa TaxID=172846 RepID=A0AAV4VN47_CAEEX|nr:hypothetical protein CEXT_573261 [Caerostris extrusa]